MVAAPGQASKGRRRLPKVGGAGRRTLVGVFTTDLVDERLLPGITVGGQALGESGSFPRIMSLFFNIPGTLLLLGGALWSVWRFARKRAEMVASAVLLAGFLVAGTLDKGARRIRDGLDAA